MLILQSTWAISAPCSASMNGPPLTNYLVKLLTISLTLLDFILVWIRSRRLTQLPLASPTIYSTMRFESTKLRLGKRWLWRERVTRSWTTREAARERSH
ncbi:hypothetical protein EV702DRAFT_1033778, partial [Suillus placidus]